MTARQNAMLSVVALVLASVASTASSQPSRLCNRTYVNFGYQVIDHNHLMHRSSTGNPGVDSAVWPAATVAAYHRAWEGFWYLDTTNYAIWLDDTTSTHTYTSWMGSEKVVHRYNAFATDLGTMAPYFVWPSNALD